ncbi:MAG: hypothetical protein QMB03_13630 [Spirosomataceae bacterium]
MSEEDFDMLYRRIPVSLIQSTVNKQLSRLRIICGRFHLDFERMKKQFQFYYAQHGSSSNNEQQIFENIMDKLIEDGTLQSSVIR